MIPPTRMRRARSQGTLSVNWMKVLKLFTLMVHMVRKAAKKVAPIGFRNPREKPVTPSPTPRRATKAVVPKSRMVNGCPVE